MVVRCALYCAFLTLVVAGCGGGGGGGSVPAPPPQPSGGGSTPPPPPPPPPGGVTTPFNADDTAGISANAGHPTFASPQAKPIALNGSHVYVANTPDDTVDIIATDTMTIVARVNVGVDPVGLAVRPDGNEVWVANHVSDSISVIDTDPDSATFRQVIATVQDFDPDTLATRFDEPVGLAFASNSKAYVTLSPFNQVAIIDATTYSVSGHLDISAQDPRALTVRDNRLYVIPFESNNQSQLSGCTADKIDGDICTFDAVEHVFSNNNVLSLNYDADIIKNSGLPDRDLYIFDTNTDTLVEIVNTMGTLLYDVAVDSTGKVFVTQTDARNTENGRAGTRGHGLLELENRAFLNQITSVNCANSCASPVFFDLEPLPPTHPGPGMALATPFGIQVSVDDATLVVTAAGSNKVFTVDANTGSILGRTDVGAAPRGIALESDTTGAPLRAWVLNTLANSVSVVDLTNLASPAITKTIAMNDPTHPDVKLGRIAFNDANASSTGTFSCESCHPDGGTDQLLWVLDTPICDVSGCTQIPPRLTMPVRGLRDTAPYHWDGIPGDPFGGINTAAINGDVMPNCSIDDPESCTRFLIDGGLASTMCDQTNCPQNDEGKDGLLNAADRDGMAKFLLSVPFPPSQNRPMNNVLTEQAQAGFFEFNFVKTCGNCHKMPFLVSSNTPDTGMEAPTWRGAYDRWMVTPQARLNIIDLMNIVNMDDSFPEKDIWILAGATEDIWQMVLQGSTGFSGAFARQVTLNASTAQLSETDDLLDALELAANEGAVLLQAEGVQIDQGVGTPIALGYVAAGYATRDTGSPTIFTRQDLLDQARAGNLVLTLTARVGLNADYANPQPALWPNVPMHAQTQSVEVAWLDDSLTLRMKGRHIQPGANVYLDGRRIEGEIRCESGTLPDCANEIVIIELPDAPADGGAYFMQVQNAHGLFSNDTLVYSDLNPVPPRPGNLISSGGRFNTWDDSWETLLTNASVNANNGILEFDITAGSSQPWRVQLSHRVWLVGGQQYSLCYDAKADASRFITAYLDSGANQYTNIIDGQRRSSLTRQFQNFRHTFTIADTDTSGRIAFDMAQSNINVQFDNIGLYEGSSCGSP